MGLSGVRGEGVGFVSGRRGVLPQLLRREGWGRGEGRVEPGAAARAACGRGQRCRLGLAERRGRAGAEVSGAGRRGRGVTEGPRRQPARLAPFWGCPANPGASAILSGAEDPGGPQR